MSSRHSVPTKPLTSHGTYLCFSFSTALLYRLQGCKIYHCMSLPALTAVAKYIYHILESPYLYPHRQHGSDMSYPLMAERRSQLTDGSAACDLGPSSHEAQPAPNWQQYFSKSSNDLISRYAHASAWSPSTDVWPENTALPSDFHSVDTRPRLSVSSLSKHGQYPESSQRTNLPSSSPSSYQPLLSNLPLPTSPSETRHTPSPTKLNELWGSNLYTIEDARPPSLPPRDDTSTPPVKQEPDDGFIMEFTNSPSSPTIFDHSLAPPTEVPLRATQASKEMRKMMGVFRLNPFTMHNSGGRGAHMPSWNGEEAGPLQEEPQLYEFQLILEGVEPDSDEPLRSFSPDFEIGHDSVQGDCVPRNEWPEYHARELSRSPSRRPSLWDHSNAQIGRSPTGTSASLEFEYPDSSADQEQGGNCLTIVFCANCHLPYCPPTSFVSAQIFFERLHCSTRAIDIDILRELLVIKRDDTDVPSSGPGPRANMEQLSAQLTTEQLSCKFYLFI